MILVGVTITTLTGNSGILNRATNARKINGIAQAEEEANLIYTSLLMDSYTAGKEPTLDEVVSELNKSGYTITKEMQEGATVTGISLSTSSVNLAPNESTDINVILEGASAESDYYALIDGKKYEIKKVNNKIKISKEETTTSTGSAPELQVSSSSADVTTAVNGTTITVTAGENKTTATITVKYGELTAQTVSVTVVKKPTENTDADSSKSITTSYATIDVVWLDTDNNVISEPNDPTGHMTADMKKVTWTKNGDTWTEDAEADTKSEWYKYKAGTGTADNIESMWANAVIKDADGNASAYFVWIPRYAYRITYYSDSELTNVTGYFDGWGLWDVDGNLKYKLNQDVGKNIVTKQHNGNKYIVHPAFETNVDNGGWGSQLAGIWVGKYETTGKTSDLTVLPDTASLRSLAIGDMYTKAIGYKSDAKSHMMKNSEWGAVAYLALSQYGRNGHEVDINNSSSYKTGTGGGATDAKADNNGGTAYKYDTTIGARASTTGNIYGVYDISGGAYEYLAAFNSVDANKCFVSPGRWTMATGLKAKTDNEEASNSTNLATRYENISSSYYGTTVELAISKIGDALIEVNKDFGSNSTGSRNHLFGDSSSFICPSYPFFKRGGGYANGNFAGLFYSNYYGGNASSEYGARLVLVS